MFSDVISHIKKLHKGQTPIALHAPVFIGNEKKYVLDCIDSTFVSSVGKYVNDFEEQIAKYTGAKQAVACMNGTAALHMALMLVGVERNTEVLTQALTFIATANAISYCGAHSIFIDSAKDNLGLCPEKLEEFLKNETVQKDDGKTYNKKTGRLIAACVPMHVFGHPVHLEKICSLCKQYNIPLIEDAAESIGSFYHGKHTGLFGVIGILSFNGNKTMTTGGGGMLLFNDVELAKKAKHLTTTAKRPHPYEFFHDEIGYNYRMPNINAALGCAQLETLPTFLKKKRELADEYKAFFGKIGIEFINEPAQCISNFWLNAIRLKSRSERDEFLTKTNAQGVMTRPCWTLMNKLPMFEHYQTTDLSNALKNEETLVNIPSGVIV